MFPRFLFVVLRQQSIYEIGLQLNNNCIRKYRKTTYETSVYIPPQPFCIHGY